MPTDNKDTPILIAAEQPLEAQALGSFLRGGGYRDVRSTSDGREIIPLHGRWPYELLILDMNMRTIASLDVLAVLTPRIDTQRLTVVTLLDERNTWLEDQARLLGARGVICGPLNRAQVLEVVGTALKYRSRVA